MHRDRPILFSTPMVQALLAGRKTQTRRALSPQPDLLKRAGGGGPLPVHQGKPVPCRYGVPGDSLWVRERWAYRRQLTDPQAPPGGTIVYAADLGSQSATGRAWRQGRHMPRSASRITLRALEIRLERLQRITARDARDEGFDPLDDFADPIDWFHQLWDGINAERGFGWATNPWVWVVRFRRVAGGGSS